MSTDDIIKLAIAEDLGSGDITTYALVPPGARFRAVVLAKECGVVCGTDVAARVFRRLNPACGISIVKRDGASVRPGEIIMKLTGGRAILSAERTALNFLQRLSGIATLTAAFVAQTKGTGARILDTRKTAPGLRKLEKYAVLCGGGHNHREGLFDAVMIKDNHIAASGWSGLARRIKKVRKNRRVKFVEIEIKKLSELDSALSCGPDIILLDNMRPRDMKAAIARISAFRGGRRPFVEISGGVALKNVRRLALLGPDRISVGSLTHSAKALDISMEII